MGARKHPSLSHRQKACQGMSGTTISEPCDMLLAHTILNCEASLTWVSAALGFLKGLPRVPLGVGFLLGTMLGVPTWVSLCIWLRLEVTYVGTTNMCHAKVVAH